MRHSDSFTRATAIALCAFLAIAISQPAAFAHAGLVSANPEANKEITVMPDHISLTFTEDLMVIGEKNVNTLSLTYKQSADAAVTINLTDVQVEGATLSAAVPADDYQSGTYEISYSIVSADGHKVSDSYRFSLNAPTLLIAPVPAKDAGHGVLPLPIVGAIALVIALGGLFAFRARTRKS
jgi:methionine-rich copper-binding protein CopC